MDDWLDEKANAVMQDDLLISKREILAILFRRGWAVALIIISSIATAAFSVYYLISPSYESHATIILNSSFLTEPLRDAPPEGGWEKLADFHTQRDILTSERIATEAVERTHLAENRVIGRIERIMMRIGDVKRYIGGILGIERWTRPWSATAAAIGAVHDFVETAVLPDSKAIQVTFRAKDPQEAARVLNAIVDAHTEYYYGVIKSRAEGVVTYLEGELARASERLRAAEGAWFAFKQKDVVEGGPSPSTGGDDNRVTTGFVGITDSTEVQQELKIYILKMEEELRRNQLQVDVDKRERIGADLRKRIKIYVNAVNSLPVRQLELTRLKREFDNAEDSVKLLQRNLAQARIVAGGPTDKIKLVDVFERAQPNDSVVFPQKKLVLILAAFLGAVLGLTWAFLFDFLDHRLYSAQDIERHLGLRLLASLEKIP